MISPGLAFHAKGLGVEALYSRMKRLMADWRSTTEWKTPYFSRLRVSLAKKPSTALSHEHEVGVKWKVQRGWRASHSWTLSFFMRGVVVENDVDRFVFRHLALDPVEEADDLLMAMALHVLPDNCSVKHVERCEQRGCAMPLVIVGHGARTALLHRQAGLGAVERLDLRLLVDGQDHRMSRRIDIEADDLGELFGENRIVRQFEAAPSMRCKAMRLPNLLHRRDGQPDDLGHRTRRPVGCFVQRRVCVNRTISATRSRGTGVLPGGRVLSRSRPSTPSCIKRSCQRHTQVFDLPVAAMIAEVPRPSLLSSTIRARQTCFCGLRGANTMSRRR